MSNSKISALTSATTPLAGTEVLPIVQSSTTKQVSVANLTAGRSVSALNFIPSGSSVPTNGVYLPAVNNVAISTNGTLAIMIDSSGNLLVGTISGTDKLTVNGSAAFKIGSTAVLGIDYTNSSGGYGSATARILGVSKNTVTGRSIGADGTINASGAD